MSRSILIIDDSKSIVFRLTEFLQKLGYGSISNTDNAQGAIDLFKDLGKTDEHPIVFLDYDVRSHSSESLLSQLLQLDVDGEIIIMSTFGKDSESIRKLIEEGAYEVIQKPLRYDIIKNIMHIVEIENSPTQEPSQELMNLFQTTNRISETWLEENSHMSKESLQKILQEMLDRGEIIQVDDVQDVCCPSCDSVKTGHIFYCPDCKKSNFEQSNLIEHYDCGCVDLEQNFVDDKCPNCKKLIKALGVDYRIDTKFYFCNKCESKFQEPSCNYLCLKCKQKFEKEKINWKSSRGFQIRS